MIKDMSRSLPLVLLTGVTFALAVLAEIPYINGPTYWFWPWRSLGLERGVLLFMPPLLFYTYLLCCWSAQTQLDQSQASRIVLGLFACAIMFQFAGLYIDPRGAQAIVKIVESPVATSYFTDATRIHDLNSWLANYSAAKRGYHSSTHPPGPTLYYILVLSLVGRAHAALVGGALLGVLASLGTVLVYHFGRLWCDDRSARIGPCFIYVLLPALIVFLPEFDQVYPIASMALLLFWARAMDQPRMAVWLGLTLFAVSFVAYNLLATGVPMLLLAVLWLHRANWRAEALRRTAVAGAIALAVVIGAYWLLWLATSYDPIASFNVSLAETKRIAAYLNRPYWTGVAFDVYDLLLGAGWLTLPLLLLSLQRSEGPSAHVQPDRALTLCVLIAILVIDLTGMVHGETARLWIFLQPLIVVPAGMQLARWGGVERAFVLGMQALIVIVLRCKMTFISV